jgi:hypothetical protein
MCDILPTGVFAAFQVLSHPKVLPMIRGLPYPLSSNLEGVSGLATTNEYGLKEADTKLTIAVLGLGPVGMVSSSNISPIANFVMTDCTVCVYQST